MALIAVILQDDASDSSHTMCGEMRHYTMRKRALEMERTREAVLAAARARLARVGYGALRVEDVARRARVSRRTVYSHFPTRAELADAALRVRADALRESVARWRPRANEASAVVDEIVAFHARSYRQEYALMETLSEGAPLSGRALLRELDAERLRNISRTVQGLASHGVFRGRALVATPLFHAPLSYPPCHAALTGPARAAAPPRTRSALQQALLSAS